MREHFFNQLPIPLTVQVWRHQIIWVLKKLNSCCESEIKADYRSCCRPRWRSEFPRRKIPSWASRSGRSRRSPSPGSRYRCSGGFPDQWRHLEGQDVLHRSRKLKEGLSAVAVTCVPLGTLTKENLVIVFNFTTQCLPSNGRIRLFTSIQSLNRIQK